MDREVLVIKLLPAYLKPFLTGKSGDGKVFGPAVFPVNWGRSTLEQSMVSV